MRFIHYLFLFSIGIFSIPLFSQDAIILKGQVVDATTNEGLPFATLRVKNKNLGTVSNEYGQFSVRIDQQLAGDSLEVSMMGYEVMALAIIANENLRIALSPSIRKLEEVVIRPKPPTFYIKQAVLKRGENYLHDSFVTQSYYREFVKENSELIEHSEAVFKSHHAGFGSEEKNAHQVLLYRKSDAIKEFQFMRDKLDKQKEKQINKMEKKAKKEGEDISTKLDSMRNEDYKAITAVFGGPEGILSMNVASSLESYLDSTRFRKYKYNFDEESTYQGRELMVINFTSKGTVEHLKQRGKIYIDKISDAIVKTDMEADVVIPLAIKPLLYLVGLEISNPMVSQTMRYQLIDEKWFPENFQVDASGTLTRKKMFSKNEHAHFDIQQVYSVNQIELEHVSDISEEKKFNPKKKISDQVFNDEGINWGQINFIP